ncbi:MAG: hypothetical protein KKB31_06895 [Nanoarchaeota archaeon]|nr:hypothetical protein [Nanoarchaeota archaeon]
MDIIFSSDVELWSWNKNFDQDVKNGLLKLVELADEEKIPITFFISLSDKGYNQPEYGEKILSLIKKIRSKYVCFGIHTHCQNLPLNFNTKKDHLNRYSKKEIISILKWYKKEIETITKKKIFVHRAGSYSIPPLPILEECFKEAGVKIDSSDISQEYSKILRIKNLVEIPPSTNKRYSKKLRVWGPEQMSPKEIMIFYKKAIKKTRVLVVNFHSFSVYGDLGKKARVWHKMPTFLRVLLKPVVKLIKKDSKIIMKEESPAFANLKKMIKYLKNNGCTFTNFENVK